MTPTVIGAATLYLGDCVEVMRTLPDNSIDSVVTDPPYELGFMGKSWDSTGIANNVEMWSECLRVLKPGGHLLAFSGSRTYHRMTCAIEDAGFEVRDQIMWIYGSGFPKSRNIGDGRGTALKPAHEPICVARKPLAGTVHSNAVAFGTGVLNIDACRIATDEFLRPGAGTTWAALHEHEGRAGEPSAQRRYVDSGGTNFAMAPGLRGGDPSGRWPANVIHDGSAEVRMAFPNAGGQLARARNDGTRENNAVFGSLRHVTNQPAPRIESDVSAARFFYCAKASRADRSEGTADLPQRVGGMISNTSGQHITRRDEGYEAKPQGNTHPTVKPTDLMAYLCRLVTPAGGIVLDPFMGSGSTGKAAMREGFRFIGIELNSEYIAIANARIAHEVADSAAAPAQKNLFEVAA